MNAGELLARAGLDSDDRLALIHPIDPYSVPVLHAPEALRSVWGSSVDAMALPGMILIEPSVLTRSRGEVARLVIHELIHLRQWHDLGIPRFAFLYLRDYLRGRRRGWGHREAYLSIGIEREARATTDLFL